MVQIVETVEPNRVAQFYTNKTILITGGSGFLGKVLVEKLLRACTELEKIYILMRVKKGRSISERLQSIFNEPLYDLLRKQQGNIIFDKVEAISANLEEPDLGLSPEDRRKLVETVDIIYHSAATVQFDDCFKKTVLLNVRGTKLMLDLARECKYLKVYIHVSTAYCQENQEILNEKTYPPPADPHKIIDICEWMSEDVLNRIAKDFRGTNANNYTFTKALGEGLVAEQMDKLPVIIERPSAVIPIWREPLPGWTDNVNGPTGLLIGAGKGVIRSMYGRGDYFADYVSVDSVANASILVAYDYVTYGSRRVYNLTTQDEVKVTFQQTIDIGLDIINNKVAFDRVLWCPGGRITNNRIVHIINVILFQLLPALFLDAILFLLGIKPFLMRVQRKILRGYRVFEYYSNRDWNFKKDNIEAIRRWQNNTEKKIFNIEADGLDVVDYFTQCAVGARRYIMKDKDENIPKALRRMKVLWYVDKICKTFILVGFLYLLYKKFILNYF